MVTKMNNGISVIKERVDNLIREVREGNVDHKGGIKKLQDTLQEHIDWSQGIVLKYEARLAQLEYKHQGFLGGHGSLASLLNFFRRG